MLPSRNALFVGLVALLGGAAFLLARDATRARPTDPDEKRTIVRRNPTDAAADSGAPETSAVELVGLDREEAPSAADPGSAATTVVYPLEVDLSLVLPGSIEIPEGVMPIRSDANAGIEGSVIAPDGTPGSAEILFVHGPNASRTLSTDGRGRFGANDLLQGISIVRVTTSEGLTAEREVHLAQLSTARLHVSFTNAAYVNGTVQDERGKALEGAEVRLDGRLAYSDSEGQFRFTGVPAGRVVALVRKEGYALTRRLVGVGLRARIQPEGFVIQLPEAATLTISVEQSIGTSDPALAFLMPAGGPGVDANGQGFPWYEVNPVSIPRGGRAVLEGLPPTSVSVRLFHRGAVARPRSKTVRLYGGRDSSVVLRLEPVPAIRGRVLDGGEPVKGAKVVVEAADRGTATTKALGQRTPRFTLQMIVPPLPAAYQETFTNAKGEFVFTSNPDVRTAYYVTATSRDGLRRGVGVLPPGQKDVTVSLGDATAGTGDLVVELPGRFQGLPVELRVQGAPRDPFVLRPGLPLAVEDLEQGTWRVKARWRGAEVVFGEIVEVGDEPVRVSGELPAGAIQGQTEEERRRVRGM
ncbi:MAG: carboxypeptidase-like regulatory domain-containing protein [Planctomycetota bacterium]